MSRPCLSLLAGGPGTCVRSPSVPAAAAAGSTAPAFFVMLAGYQYMSAGGSVRAVESAKGSLYNALIGLAIVILCKIIARLVGGALGAPGATGMVLGPTTWMLWQ